MQQARQPQSDVTRTDAQVVLGVPGKPGTLLVALAGDVEAVPLQVVEVVVTFEIPRARLGLQRPTRVARVAVIEEISVRDDACGLAAVARVCKIKSSLA